jgi:hypothetical protein
LIVEIFLRAAASVRVPVAGLRFERRLNLVDDVCARVRFGNTSLDGVSALGLAPLA